MKNSIRSLRTLRSLLFICVVAALIIPFVSLQKSDARFLETEAAISPAQSSKELLAAAAAPMMMPQPFLPPCTIQPGLIISEFRLRGAAGANDEFIELYNSTDSAITVCTTDGSAGWAVAARNAAATSATTLFVIPIFTVIPPRGHYLGVNNAVNGYSLGSYPAGVGTTATGDATYSIGVDDNAGIALFNTATEANFSTSTRLDAAGFAGPFNAIADLYREGAGFPQIGTANGQYTMLRRISSGFPADQNDNQSDFWFLSTTAGNFGGSVGSSLGAPGPENLGSPVVRNSVLPMFVIDSTVSTSVAPNRVRDFTSDPANNSNLGTLAMRRRVVNNSGVPITRLRFPVTTITTFPTPNGTTADMRVRSVGATTITNVNDAGTCAAVGTPATPPCSVTLQATTVEEPPGQPMGGGYNSTVTVNLAQPLAPGASVAFQFLTGLQQSGSFVFLVNCAALPASNPPAAPSGLTATAESNSVINLSWTDNSNDETSFRVERKTGAAGTWAETGSTFPNTTVYSSGGLLANTQYFYRVRATNSSGNSAYSAEASALTANLLPSVSLTAPTAGQVFNAPASMTLTANASDPDGSISKVQFFQGTTLLNEDLTAPYSFAWNNVPAGSYNLTAKAFDNLGATTTSAAVAVVVNALPTVSITSPTHPTTIAAPATFTINATASDPDGSITKVQFFAGASFLGEDSTAPFSWPMNNLGSGVYSLTARAFDNRGATTTSALVSVVVNALPTVSITSPTPPVTLIAPATWTINATASDPDGSIVKVEFFAGAGLLGTDTTAPYSWPMNNMARGVYSLTAVATDNLGGTKTSNLVPVVVTDAPQTNITFPLNNSGFMVGANINIQANASDDNSVNKVEFFQNGVLLFSDDTVPYSFLWTNIPAGTYSLTTKATDNTGIATTSTPVSITVLSPNGISRLDPMNRTGGGSEDPLSRNYNWSARILSLPGRTGLDVGLSLSYNSLVWTRTGNFVTFDDDKGWPGPGFRLGFPVIQAQYFNNEVGKNAYLLIAPDGTRVELRQVGSTTLYEAADSSHLLLDTSNMTVRTTDGREMQYVWQGSDFQCTKIRDANGNFITINYTSFGRLNTIVDTLGRTIKFNYNADNTLSNISQAWAGQSFDQVWAFFTYQDVQFRTNFVNVSKVGAVNLSTFKALRSIQLVDGSAHVFDYNTWGQVHKISHYASDQHVLNYRTYNLPLNDSVALDDCPRFTERRDWAENWNRGGSPGQSGLPTGAEEEVVTATFTVPTAASWTTPDGTAQSGIVAQITAADGTFIKNYFNGQTGTASGWQRGLAAMTETFARSKPGDPISKQKTVVNKWTQDNTSSSFILNPRLEETNVYDHNAAGQVITRKRSSLTYQTVDLGNGMSCRLPSDLFEYQANATNVLRRTHTDYNLNSAYITRRILGLVSEKLIYGTNPQTGVETLASRTGFAYDEAGSIQGNDAPIQHEAGFNSGFVLGRGNLSSVKRYDVTNGQFTLSTSSFNTAGSPVAIVDPSGHQQTMGYLDNFSDGNNSRNTLAYVTSATDADGGVTSATYRFEFGGITRTQAPAPAGQSAGSIRNFTYDQKVRLERIALEFGANTDYSHTRFEYSASQNRMDTYVTLQNGAGEAHSFQLTDGFGRVFAIANDHPGSSGGLSGRLLLYDRMGRAIKSSNPTETNAIGAPTDWVATGDDAAAGWLYAQQSYDWKGRPLVSTNPDGTTKEASYSSCGCAGGDTVTLTDEGTIDNGVARRRQLRMTRDILGRAVKAESLNWENGSVYTTSVTNYNALDQQTLIREYAGDESSTTFQDTVFTYDGFGRLKTQHLPEYAAGLNTTFNYNADDTIQSVMDPRGTTATMTYNNRHMPLSIVYSVPAGSNIGVTPAVNFGYDAAGNRTSMSDGMGSMTYSYNQLSRMISETRTFADAQNSSINGVSRTITYDYNLAGDIASINDGLGATLNYGFDVTGRLNTLSGTGYAVANLVTNMQYRAWNTLKSQTNGNGYTESATYNSRMLLTAYEVRSPSNVVEMSTTHSYYNDAHLRFSDALDERFDRAFAYDHLGRIKEAYSGSEARDFINGTSSGAPTGPYRQSFQYNAFDQVTQQIDRLWSQAAATTNSNFTNGRKDGWNYDEAGRLIGDDTTTYTRDAAGRITHKAGEGVAITLRYDGNGQVLQENSIRPVFAQLQQFRKYFLRATAMSSAIIADLNQNGGKTKGYVYAGKRKIAESAVNLVTWTHQNPVTNSTGESTSTGFFGATEELSGSGVNIGLHEPEPIVPSEGFDMPEPMRRGMDLFGGSNCSIANPNCTTCYLDGMEHSCGHVMALAQAGALQIQVQNDRGETRFVDVEVILGVLHVPGHTEFSHEERPGGLVPVDDNNPDGPWVWSPDGTTLVTNITYIQGAFLSLPTQPLFGIAFAPNTPFTGDKLKDVTDAIELAKKMTDASRGNDAKKCDEALKTITNGKIPSLNALVSQYVASGAGGNIFDGRTIAVNNNGVDSPSIPAFVTGTGTPNATTYLNSQFFNFSGLQADTARAIVLLHEAVHHFGKMRDVDFDANSKKPSQFKGSHNISNAIIDACFPILKVLFKGLYL